MRFAEPQMLIGLLLLPLLLLAAWWSASRRRRAIARFAGGAAFADRFTGDVSVHRRAVKLLLLAVGLGASVLALARPQWGTRLEPVTRRGADVVVVLDSSLSMATEDLTPNRMARATRAVDSLLQRIGGDRVALVTFGSRAEMVCPLTLDHAALRLFLDGVDAREPPAPGTSLASALTAALRALDRAPGEADDRGHSIVLLTDGEDHEGGLDELLPELERKRLPVYALGAGTTEGGPIPLRGASGAIDGYKKDHEGRVVTSRLDESLLERIALETGGRYWRLTPSEKEIEELSEILAGLEAGEIGVQMRARYEERFQIPLVVGCLALLAEAVLGDRRRRAAGPADRPEVG